MDTVSSEFRFLKAKRDYPRRVRAIAIANIHYDTKTKRLYFDRPAGSQWVVSLWIVDERCQIDLAVVLKDGKLEFIEGYCFHGEECPQVERMKQAILESEAFSQLREDLVHELFQRTVADPSSAESPPSESRATSRKEDGERL